MSARAVDRALSADGAIAHAVAAVADGGDVEVWVGFLVETLGARGRHVSPGQAELLLCAGGVW